MTLSMTKLAFVLTAQRRRAAAIDFGGSCNGLARFGHLPTLVCPGNHSAEANLLCSMFTNPESKLRALNKNRIECEYWLMRSLDNADLRTFFLDCVKRKF